MQLIAPFYKGIIQEKSRDSQALIDKRDPDTGNLIPDGRYVDLVREFAGKIPPLTQDIARACASALVASDLQRRGEDSRLITVEGCPQMVGGQPVVGADIMQAIWKNVVPSEIMTNLPEPIAQRISDCTVAEVRAILANIPDGGDVHGITHAYHQDRVQKMLQEEAGANQKIQPVLTPEQVVESLRINQPYEHFMADLIAAGAPDSKTVESEMKKETFVYGPLHALSHLFEKMSFGDFNLEMFLAKKLRK